MSANSTDIQFNLYIVTLDRSPSETLLTLTVKCCSQHLTFKTKFSVNFKIPLWFFAVSCSHFLLLWSAMVSSGFQVDWLLQVLKRKPSRIIKARLTVNQIPFLPPNQESQSTPARELEHCCQPGKITNVDPLTD